MFRKVWRKRRRGGRCRGGREERVKEGKGKGEGEGAWEK